MKLIIAEKQTAARTLAKILLESPKSVRRGKVVYFYEKDTVIFPLSGHIIDVDFPKEFKYWSLKTLPSLIEAPIVEKVVRWDIYKLLSTFRPLMIIIATDSDREGEAIGLEVVKKLFRGVKTYRLWYSALTREEITTAMENLRPPNVYLAEAAFTRRDVDLLWGSVLTRALSIITGRRGKEFLSVGRVQTPTLAFIVEREREIRSFKPETFYYVELELEKDGIMFKARSGTFKNKEAAQNLLKSVGDSISITGISIKERKLPRPVPFNTTTFLSDANRWLGVSPSKAMEIAEELYMEGYISYPRTDNQMYPPHVKKYIQMIAPLYNVTQIFNPSSGRKTEDHPPIHPVRLPEGLEGLKLRIYDLIARRFVATFMEDALLRDVNVKLGVFHSRGLFIIRRGWLDVYFHGIREEKVPVTPGTCRVIRKRLREGRTSPPPRYTPGDVIKKMESLGLGTKSTRQDILRKLYERGYIEGSKRIKATKLGEFLYDTLKALLPDTLSPVITSKLEEDMSKIERGLLRREDVLRETRKILHTYVDTLLRNRDAIKSSFELTHTDAHHIRPKKKPVGKRRGTSRKVKKAKTKEKET